MKLGLFVCKCYERREGDVNRFELRSGLMWSFRRESVGAQYSRCCGDIDRAKAREPDPLACPLEQVGCHPLVRLPFSVEAAATSEPAGSESEVPISSFSLLCADKQTSPRRVGESVLRQQRNF